MKMNRDRTPKPNDGRLALVGWSLPMIEAVEELQRPYIIIGPPHVQEYAHKYGLPFIGWDFDKYRTEYELEHIYDLAEELYKQLQKERVEYAIPLFEETVEWAGAINARLKNKRSIFDHYLLFRDKARMKRRALMGGLQVGVFEEANSIEDVHQFFKRVNDALLLTNDDENDPAPVHIKAFDKAGAAYHRVIRSESDITEKLSTYRFPCLMESHLNGVEVSCEVFIHNGRIQFMNITEYVVFGHSMMAPPSKEIEEKRPMIREAAQKLVNAFDIECGVIHPEFFIDDDDTIYFGEVAYRVAGGHIYELMQRTYDNFNPFLAHLLCCDPNTCEDDLQEIFPDETKANGHAGSLLVYPRVDHIQGLNIPPELEEHPGFDRHNMFTPVERKVQEREGYGNHHGTVYFHHEDSEQVKQPLTDFVEHDFYF